MAVAILQLPDTPTRLLTPKEAATYCRFRNTKRFEAICPVQSLSMDNGVRVYDIKDIDAWIDSFKSSNQTISNDSIISRLDAIE